MAADHRPIRRFDPLELVAHTATLSSVRPAFKHWRFARGAGVAAGSEDTRVGRIPGVSQRIRGAVRDDALGGGAGLESDEAVREAAYGHRAERRASARVGCRRTPERVERRARPADGSPPGQRAPHSTRVDALKVQGRAGSATAPIAANLGRVFVAIDEHDIIGHIQIVRGPGAGQCEVKNMAVRLGHQGRGIGRTLVEAAIDLVAAESCKTLLVATAAADVDNLRLPAAWIQDGVDRPATRTPERPATPKPSTSTGSNSVIASG